MENIKIVCTLYSLKSAVFWDIMRHRYFLFTPYYTTIQHIVYDVLFTILQLNI
jgi:hypothetical protein